MPQKPNSYHGNSVRNSIGPGSRLKKMAASPGALNASLNSSFNLNSSTNSTDVPWHDDRKPSGRKRLGSSKRRGPLSTAEIAPSSGFPALSEIDGIDPDEELRDQLREPLEECSRQRLRAIRISLRRLGGNVENRITGKELWSVFSEHNIKISGRIFQMILNKYEDQFGVDYEKLWKFMVEAQKLTGRDSVQATNKLNESFSRFSASSLEEYDAEDINMLVRLHRALQNSTEFDLDEMRATCQDRDKGRSGQIDKKQMRKICDEQHLPVHGALLNGLLNRCDDEKNGQISWPEVVTFLERAASISIDPQTGEPDIVHMMVRPLSGRRPRSSRPRPIEPLKESAAEIQISAGPALKKSSPPQKESTGDNTPTSNRKARFDFSLGNESEKNASSSKALDSPREKANETKKEKKGLELTFEKKVPESVLEKKVPESSKGRKTPESPREKIPHDGNHKSVDFNKEKEKEMKKEAGKERKEPDSPRELTVPESPREATTTEKKFGSTKSLKSEKKIPVAIAIPIAELEISEKVKGEAVKPDSSENTPRTEAKDTGSTEPGPTSHREGAPQEVKTEGAVQFAVAETTAQTATSRDAVSTASLKSTATVEKSETQQDRDEKNQQDKEENQKSSSRQSSAKTPTHSKKDGDASKTGAKVETKKPGSGKGVRSRPPVNKSVQNIKAAATPNDKGKKNTTKDDKTKKGSAGKIPKNSSNASLASYESHHSKGKTVSVGSAAETVSTNSTNLTVESNVTSNSTNSTNSDNSHTHASSQESTSDIKDTASVLKTMSSTSLASMATSQGETINSTNELQDLNSSQDTASELMKPLLPPEPQEKTVPPTPPPPPPEIKVTRKDSTSSFKNSASNVKNSGGFLSSVKSLFKGNKNKENNQEMIPIVTVNSPEPSSESDPVLPPPGGAVHEVTIRGRSMKYFMPDMYYHKTINSYPPKEKLELDWIYGYRGNDCRCNIYMLASGEAIYFTATFVIIFNIEQKFQRYYKEHTTEIRSIALHPNRVTVATGQIAKGKEQAHIRIWQADTLQTLQVLGIGLISKSVMCLAFAQAQDRLVSIDNGDVKTMVIWDINKGKEIAKTSVNTEIICQVGFHPKNANNLVTVGKEHQIWWTANPSEGTIEEMMRANFEEKWMKAKYVICMMFKANGDLITGDSNGTIYVWHDGGNTVSQAIKHAHEGPVFSLIMIRNHLVSAGRDGLLLSWTWGRNFDQSGSMQLPKSEGGIRMLCHSKDMILIGTTLNSILTCNMATTGAPLMGISSLHKTPMTQSHYDEARALTTYPSNTQQGLFVTGGYDGIIAMFDAHQHKTVWKHSIKGLNIHCLDIHPNGKLLALGVRDASVSVVYINGSTEISELCKAKVAKDRINCIKFSPDGECLAVGCYDKNIYILQLLEGGKKCESIGKCKGHNSLVTGLDWSVDKPFGNYILQSSSLGFEHFYWDGASCEKLENPSELRNIEWVSHNCMMGYPVSGIMGSSSDNSTVYAVDRSYNHRLVATVNERKQIHLYNYPCSSPEAQSRVYEANHVDTVNISFVYGNSYLITLGGKDTCIMQWKIVSS